MATAVLFGATIASAGSNLPVDDATPPISARVKADIAQAEQDYLIGPSAADKLGCTIAWQARIPMAESVKLSVVSSSPDAVLALNSRNELALLRPRTGDRVWSRPALRTLERPLGLFFLTPEGISYQVPRPLSNFARRLSKLGESASHPTPGIRISDGFTTDPNARIVCVGESEVVALNPSDGESVIRATPSRVPSTTAHAAGSSVVWGTNSGQLVWFESTLGNLRAGTVVDGPAGNRRVLQIRGEKYTTPSAVVAAPATDGSVVVVGSKAGVLAALDAQSGASMWRREFLDGLESSPVIHDNLVVVAGADQYLRALDLGSGTTMWEYFVQDPLRTQPFVCGPEGSELVLQDIPGEGWVAFSLRVGGEVGGDIGGKVLWKLKGVSGTPIGVLKAGDGNSAMFWSPAYRVLTLVDLKRGKAVDVIDLPNVEHLEADTVDWGGFMAWSSDGRIERLQPVAREAPTAVDATSGNAGGEPAGRSESGSEADADEASED